MRKGKKYDKDKPMFHLLPWRELQDVAAVLTFGANIYGEEDWKHFVSRGENWKRYVSACCRHIAAMMNNEEHDKETGIDHTAHAICCLLFVLWRRNELRKNKIQQDRTSRL